MLDELAKLHVVVVCIALLLDVCRYRWCEVKKDRQCMQSGRAICLITIAARRKRPG